MPTNTKPITGYDIDNLRSRERFDSAEMSYAMALPPTKLSALAPRMRSDRDEDLSAIVKDPALAILTRLYWDHPEAIPVVNLPTVNTVYALLNDLPAPAEMSYPITQKLFSLTFGREVSAGHRWLRGSVCPLVIRHILGMIYTRVTQDGHSGFFGAVKEAAEAEAAGRGIIDLYATNSWKGHSAGELPPVKGARPTTGLQLTSLQTREEFESLEMQYLLGQSPNKLSALLRFEARDGKHGANLPVPDPALGILFRLYWDYPELVPLSQSPKPGRVFELLQADEYRTEEGMAITQNMFALSLGREASCGYRWLRGDVCPLVIRRVLYFIEQSAATGNAGKAFNLIRNYAQTEAEARGLFDLWKRVSWSPSRVPPSERYRAQRQATADEVT